MVGARPQGRRNLRDVSNTHEKMPCRAREGGSRGCGSGGVGGRGTGPRDGANFATCVEEK